MSPHSLVTTLKEKETWVVTMICPICYVGGRDLNLPSVCSRNVDVFCLSPGNGGEGMSQRRQTAEHFYHSGLEQERQAVFLTPFLSWNN